MSDAVNAPLPSAVHATAGARAQVRLKESSLLVWRVVAAAGPGGCGRQHIIDRLHPRLDRDPVIAAVASLGQTRYIISSGPGTLAKWSVKRVPLGEATPPWMLEAADTGSAAGNADDDDELGAREPAKVQLPARPASVFTLGEEGIPGDVRVRRGPRSPATADDTAPKPAGLGWVAPPAAQCKPEPAAAPPAPAEPSPAVATTAPPPSPTAPSPCAQHPLDAEPRQSPHFALHSDGTFEIHVDDGNDYVVLRPDTTRAMFRWLDRLGGTHLSRAVEVTS